MTKNIINLTAPTIATEIEIILATYPHHPYQQAFAAPGLRQELIAYVLSRVSNHYTVVETGEPAPSEASCGSVEEQSCREALIRRGIEDILQIENDRISQHIPDEIEPDSSPSHWFG